MKRQGIRFTLAVAAISVVVAAIGALAVSGPARAGVYVGTGLGFALQVSMFWLFFVWLLPGHFLVAYGLSVAGRFLVVLATAIVGVQLGGLPALPTLFALVGVLFLSTVLEPLFLKTNRLREAECSS